MEGPTRGKGSSLLRDCGSQMFYRIRPWWDVFNDFIRDFRVRFYFAFNLRFPIRLRVIWPKNICPTDMFHWHSCDTVIGPKTVCPTDMFHRHSCDIWPKNICPKDIFHQHICGKVIWPKTICLKTFAWQTCLVEMTAKKVIWPKTTCLTKFYMTVTESFGQITFPWQSCLIDSALTKSFGQKPFAWQPQCLVIMTMMK
jgi:hypothetical protein